MGFSPNRHTAPGPAGERLLLTAVARLAARDRRVAVGGVAAHAARRRRAGAADRRGDARRLRDRGDPVRRPVARVSLVAVQALMLGTTTVISVAAAASAERGSVYGLFYLWATLYAFSFFSRRQALAAGRRRRRRVCARARRPAGADPLVRGLHALDADDGDAAGRGLAGPHAHRPAPRARAAPAARRSSSPRWRAPCSRFDGTRARRQRGRARGWPACRATR